MSDYTFQHIVGHWRHLVDDTVRDPDGLPDTISPNGHVVFTPWLGEDGQLPAGDPTALVSVDAVTALIVDGDLADLQGRPGITLVATIGENPVWWTATPRLSCRGITIPGKKITFGPMGAGVEVNLADLIDLTAIPPDQIPAYKDAQISAAQAAASASTADEAAARAETAAAGVADISDQVTQVAGYSAAAETAADTAIEAKDTAVSAAASAQTIVDNAEQVIRDDLTTEITAATTAATAATAAKDAAVVARTGAETAASAASGSASAANSSKTAAAGSATAAGSSASNAAAARTAAETARDDASESATAAAVSEAAAAASASAAGTSASTSATAKDASEAARAGAEVARDDAALASGAATAARTAAETAATAAEESKTATAAASTAADGSATAAEAAAANAAGDRSAAQAAKTSAETAASNAAGSASAAASSETNASTSASNAHASEVAAAQSAQDAADVVNDGIANATATTKGGIKLPGGTDGELGGTWDHPTVAGWTKKADLVDGVVPTSQIPALATIETHVVASESERLSLVVERGDIAVQTDDPGRGTWILKGTDPSAAADWVLMTAPTDAVASVNGQSGVVVLGQADVGLGSVDNTSDSAKPVSVAQQAALDARVPVTRTITAGTGLTGGGTLEANRAFDIAFGQTAGKVAQGNDSRFSDKRAPVDGSVKTVSIEDGAVTKAKLAASVQTSLEKADTAVQGSGLTIVTSTSDPASGTPATTITLVY